MMMSSTCSLRAKLLLALLLVICVETLAHSQDSKKPCAKSLAECPVHGCDDADSPSGLLSSVKKRKPTKKDPIVLTFEDLAKLQDQASELVGQRVELDREQRAMLRNLDVAAGAVSEGDLVEIAGFLTGLPRRPGPSGAEKVNCRLTGVANNDFHIPLVANPKDSEFEGIVVEMIPQNRPDGWTSAKLKKIARDERLVVVRGQLFYDNPHDVNDDPDEDKHGQPKRMSLWEVHPVTELFVCMTANKHCNTKNLKTQQWIKLENVKQ